MCISLLNSKMRFFATNTGNPNARLKVQVLYNGGVGSLAQPRHEAAPASRTSAT